jgi:uncharacterized protein (DUF362 family)
MSTVPVSLVRATRYGDRPTLRAAIEHLLEPLGGMGAFVKQGDRSSHQRMRHPS